ncbi:unnamed protein product [Linum trigynum]|uniref:Uncharacterized protein n=1 Tax=Linum trigynum TaxID=586398 RepID=A0AAV2E442_9ROSI
MDEKEELVAGFQLEGDATSSTPMQGFFDVATSMEDEMVVLFVLDIDGGNCLASWLGDREGVLLVSLGVMVLEWLIWWSFWL